MTKNYFLPEKFRAKLQEIYGTPIFGTKEEIACQYNKFLKEKKYSLVITVGDFCSLHLKSDVKIFDRKVQRQDFSHKFPCPKSILNPAGTIQKETWPAVSEAIKNRTNLCVDGEEDLLVIPAALEAPQGSLIVYGFPNRGICLLEVDSELKKSLQDMLSALFIEQ